MSGLAVLPELPYEYGALEPVISGEIMELHHSKHHQAYVTNFNKAVEALDDAKAKSDSAAIVNLTKALKFNGGGHVNHSIFWKNLAPVKEGGGAPPTGPLAEAINDGWGSLDNFITKFNAAAAGVEGSGWAWLALDPTTKALSIVTTPNQDPCGLTGNIPLLGIDVWEHAYYLQYKNVRPQYLANVWKVVNWADVGERYSSS